MAEIDALLQENRRFPAVRRLAREAIVNDPASTSAPPPIPKRSGRSWRASSTGCSRGTRCSSGTRRTRSGSSAASSTPASTASTATSADRGRNKAALIWEGEPGDRRTLTYWDLYREVSAFANVLKSLGVKRGDRVALYLPLIPELAIAMLACARIGAVHSVVFGGFSAESLRDRINDAQAVLLVTADGGYRRGQIVPLKQMADEALKDTPSIQNVVVVQRQAGAPIPVHMKEGRDHWYHRLMQDAPPTASRRRWTRRTCSTSSTRPAPPGSRRASCTPPAAT